MSNRVALVTGSATGLGKRMIIDLAKEGYDVIVNYRQSKEKALSLKKEVEETYHVKATCLQGDISKFEDVERIVNEALQIHGKIDILVNNAGPFVFDYKDLVDYSLEEWDSMLNGNMSSVFYLVKLLVPLMRENKWGRIINFGFSDADSAPAWVHRSAYAASKVGLVSLTKTLSLEEAKHGITVNMVCPGDIVHPWKEATIEQTTQTNDADDTPIGRVGSGEDISRVVRFLCDEKSDFITGAVIPVTGGKKSFV